MKWDVHSDTHCVDFLQTNNLELIAKNSQDYKDIFKTEVVVLVSSV